MIEKMIFVLCVWRIINNTMKKRCTICKEAKSTIAFSNDRRKKSGKREECKECRNKRQRAYHGQPEIIARARQYRYQIRKQCLQQYGNKCILCGNPNLEFLEIDHINGGGGKHRKECGNTTKMYRSIFVKGYRPDKYRLLCKICNQLSRWLSDTQIRRWWRLQQKPRYNY